MIRRATVEDLPALEPLSREFYAASAALRKFDLEKFSRVWKGMLQSEMGVIFLLIDDGEIVGTLGAVKHLDIYSNEMLAVEMFWFARSDRRGDGVRLYRAFEEWAREQGCDHLRMALLKDSMPAKVADFYRRMGFRPIEDLYEKRLAA